MIEFRDSGAEEKFRSRKKGKNEKEIRRCMDKRICQKAFRMKTRDQEKLSKRGDGKDADKSSRRRERKRVR